MRTIKFRAWWQHPEYCINGMMCRVAGIMFAKQDEGEPEYDMRDTLPVEIALAGMEGNYVKIGWNNADECKLMQFTGLLDVNGKEIYEGDIVKSLSYNEIQEIKWHEHLFVELEENNGFPSCAGWFIHTPHSSELEIIGNVYQNPELLTD